MYEGMIHNVMTVRELVDYSVIILCQILRILYFDYKVVLIIRLVVLRRKRRNFLIKIQ